MSSFQSDGQALLTGALMAAVMGWRSLADMPLQILDVKACYDEDGNYEPFFTVTMPSGTYLVSTALLQLSPEEIARHRERETT